ncbi:arylsulfotransferase family protein [Salinirubrum litoreum]|uniref:Arylsulfotransferase family protein n=1 Tax=Salinirubrum litoreum TaxID=1126234 RepID=A0ABD5RC04_9EURY|nr:arylsulfotransferase family protein [Salinirubrum litoreum]
MWRRRLLVVAAILAVVFVPVPTPADVPTTLGDLSPSGADSATGPQPTTATDADSITWITTQGHWRGLGGGELVAVDTATGERLWTHDRYNHYYDVDPLNESHLLVSAGGVYSGQWAIEIDWRENRVVRRVQIPWDTHDVDALPSGDWVVADKDDSRVVEINPGTGAVGWEYRFDAHYDREQNGVAGDFTHLNDVDAIRNGSAYLLSPRNFDRVLVVNRSTKETEWVLGGQGDHATLERQHNPTLLTNRSAGGPRVLVADSENDRVIEYHRTGGDWRATWTYAGNLSWPRDADRLPNGNTLIVDSGGQRVLEVTPDGEIVWERQRRLHPYDAERQSFGDEPGGPPLDSGLVAPPGEANGGESDSLALLAWVPPRPTLALLLLLGWIGVELRGVGRRLRRVVGRD